MENIIKQIIVYLGIPTIVASFVYIGKKLQILDDLKDTINKIKCNLKVVSDVMISSPYIEIDPEKLQSYSPMGLTEKGLDFLKEKLNFVEIFENHQKDFFAVLDEEKPKSKYDVETIATKSVIYLFDKDYFQPIKNYIYNNPQESLNTIVAIIGVYIRDKYLEAHQEIK